MSRSKCCQTMLISQRMMFMLLLTRLQWTRCEPTTTSAKITESSMNVATSSSTTVTNSASSRVTEYDTETNSITLLETQSNEAKQQLYSSTEDTTQSFTSNNKISFNSEISATTSNSLAISESNTDTTYTKPATNSFTTTTSDVSFTTMVTNSDVTSDTQTTTVTAPPDNNTSTMPLNTINTAKTGLTKSIQSTSLHPSLTNSSAETHVPTKENQINGGVIFGAIVGAVLGTALIGLVGYFMCKKRKSEGFAHQRLYDDTRNDPVLRLDNAPESYGGSFEDTSYYNPTMANETAAQKGDVPPYDAIPMDDMTLSPHLP